MKRPQFEELLEKLKLQRMSIVFVGNTIFRMEPLASTPDMTLLLFIRGGRVVILSIAERKRKQNNPKRYTTTERRSEESLKASDLIPGKIPYMIKDIHRLEEK